MANWRGCLPAAKHHHHHHHLILRSLLLPVCGCLFPHHHNRWEDKRKLQYRRCGRTIVAGLFGNGRAPLSDLDLHAAATRAASIRFRESHRPVKTELKSNIRYQWLRHLPAIIPSPPSLLMTSCLIWRLVLTMSSRMQIVLLTDGFDTRPYRLKWPSRTVIFDISLESVFKVANRSLQSAGAEIMKTCKYIHIPLESYDSRASLCKEGFDGGRPSLWAIQGLPIMTLADFGEILSVVSSLGTKGCIFVGELPGCLFDTGIGNKVNPFFKITASHAFSLKIRDVFYTLLAQPLFLIGLLLCYQRKLVLHQRISNLILDKNLT